MFKLKRPCANCPFTKQKDTNNMVILTPDRAQEIANAVLKDNEPFFCHKTTGVLGRSNQSGKQFCAGALQMLHFASKKESPFGNASVQIAERLGIYDPTQQDFHAAETFSTAEEMVAWHKEKLTSKVEKGSSND